MRSNVEAGPVLIVGGAGFIGSNLAHRLARDGQRVRVYDNFSRAGVEKNLDFLQRKHGERIQVWAADVRDTESLREAIHDASAVFHLAAQVAVTHSLEDPRHDLDVNVCGTFEVLEAIRALPSPPPLVFTSTNKVYGSLSGVELVQRAHRWYPTDAALAARGVAEDRCLGFRSPYGCSKGAADQYVLDYAATYGLPATVFRMSCIYGPHQFGTEDQGWVAHFLLRAIENRPITIYGDGKQVRDILYVDDLVRGLLMARERIESLKGRAFNIGGGPDCAVSLLELLNYIEEIQGHRPDVEFADWRLGDQRYYVSDYRSFENATGWRPRTFVSEGLRRLHAWLNESVEERPRRRSSSSSLTKGA